MALPNYPMFRMEELMDPITLKPNTGDQIQIIILTHDL